MPEKLPTEGMFGRPPAGAPYETTNSNVGPTAEQIAAAHANERTLQPLVFGVVPRGVIADQGPASAEAVLEQTFATPPPTSDPRKTMTPAMTETPVPVEDRSHQPAASSTDSPSRGVPRPITDTGKQITGGFGD